MTRQELARRYDGLLWAATLPFSALPWAENQPLRKDYSWIKIEAVLYFGVYHLPCLRGSAHISVRISLRLFVRLRNMYGFSFRKTEALGSDGKSLTSFFKDESTVWDTLGVQIIGMSTFTDMEHSEFSGRQIFRPKCVSPPAKLCGVV